MNELIFIFILFANIGLSVTEAQSTVLGGQVYDEIGECHMCIRLL
jgi:hypothetical protein